MSDELAIILVVLLAIGLLLAAPVGVVIALVRLGRLAARVQWLESRLSGLSPGRQPTPADTRDVPGKVLAGQPPVAPAPIASAAVAAAQPSAPQPVPTGATSAESADVEVLLAEAVPEAVNWETFIGRKALGWVAVVVLLFATAFFLRYAFENQWIGPLGRVTMGVLAGLALTYAGTRYFASGWHVFSQMLTAAGVVLLYLSTYSALGFYHLLDQRAAAVFLAVIVVESALLALWYDSQAIALMAVIGGLLTPLLMQTDHDQYVSLFAYLAVLNAGVLGLLLRRAWPLVGSVALAGTQGLFWAWYLQNYHPRKLAWALGFQLVIYGLCLAQTLLVNLLRPRRAMWEDLLRLVAAPVLLSTAAYVLLEEDYRPWLGSLAIGMSALYALVARWLLTTRTDGGRLSLAALAIACGFIGLAFPLEAAAPWVALGWAAEAAVLWWFGLRIRSGPLRTIAAAFAALAGLHILTSSPWNTGQAAVPVLNRYALPALAATGCLLAALASTRRFFDRLRDTERPLAAAATIGCVLLVWYIESLDIGAYFHGHAGHLDNLATDRVTQMSLSAWWAVYATLVLAAGFRLRLGLLRWTSLGLYALTIGKVFLFDMSGLDQIYRIVAFFVLAVLLGVAAWAYQRFQPDPTSDRS